MRSLFFVVFFVSFCNAFSQSKSDLQFIGHLLNKGDYKEVIFLINRDSVKFNSSQKDSLFYYLGWAHYSVKNLDQSILALQKVGKNSAFYLKSQFFTGYQQIYLGIYEDARSTFYRLPFDDDKKSSLASFELTGIEMLEGKWPLAKQQLKQIDSDYAFLNQQVEALQQIAMNFENHHKKSPLLAGIMSGIIPGSGKIYAGRTGEGIASMIATAGFGLITWENYQKLGYKNLKTLFFGSIFLASYISNIYGSVISVKIEENNFTNVTHNQVLFQLHIPLRNFFD